MGRFWKSAKLAIRQRLYNLCKIVNFGQKIKLAKTCEKPFYNLIRIVVGKKPLQKTANIWEMGRF